MSKNKNEDAAPVQKEEPIGNLSKKRKLAEFLVSSDLNIFKRHLEDIKKLNDKDFNELFQGNTEFKFNVANEKSFKQLVQKFEDNKDLISEWYDKEEYYNCISQIWRPNIFLLLRDKENVEKQKELLAKYKIDISKWDGRFRERFIILINISPIKKLAEKMKIFVKEKYGDFDELINISEKCIKILKNNGDFYCNKVEIANLDASLLRLIKEFVPYFLNHFSGEISKNTEKTEEEFEIKKIVISGLSKGNEKRLIDKVRKKYTENISEPSFENKEEKEKLKYLNSKFNTVKIKECDFTDKTGYSSSDIIIIKFAVLCLNIANLSLILVDLNNIIFSSNKFKEEVRNKIDENRKKCLSHQSEVKIISDDLDVAIEKINNDEQKFKQDLLEFEELMNKK